MQSSIWEWIIENGKLVPNNDKYEKMRHVRHAMEKQAVDVGPNGLVVLGPLFD